MTWGELLRITPGMFLAMEEERAKAYRASTWGARLVATIVARVHGNQDVDFLSDGVDYQASSEDLCRWFDQRVSDGETVSNSGQKA